MNKKAKKSNAIFSRKKTRKKKMDSSNPSYQSMDCDIDLSILLEFFHLSQNVYHAAEKKQLRCMYELKRMGSENC